LPNDLETMTKIYISLIFIFVFCFSVSAQNNVLDELQQNEHEQMLEQAKKLHSDYRFADAIDICESIINSGNASSGILELARLQIALCENARNLVNYMYEPKVIGKQKAKISNFITYYDSFENGYFAPRTKSMLMDADEGREDDLPLVFYPNEDSKNADVIYFSSYGRYGDYGLSIYKITRIYDTIWSEPEMLESTINTQFDEIYPYLAEDGKTLYFASNGHYGIGGFDLFKSTFDEKEGKWKQAENLGFPFSTPHDDFLYIPDNVNLYACFSSTRDCESEDVFVYKTRIELNPNYKSITDFEKLKEIAKLDITEDDEDEEEEHIEVNVAGLKNNDDYIQMLRVAKYYGNAFNEIQKSLDDLRNSMFDTEDREERLKIRNKVVEKESELFKMQSMVSELSLYISKSEYDFITKGLQPVFTDDLKSLINIDVLPKKETKQDAVEVFGNQTPENVRISPNVVMKAKTITESEMFDFRTFSKTIIVNNYDLPGGLIYRIQVASAAIEKELEIDFFKRCSPVTTEILKNARKYYIGLFRASNEAENALGQLKILGFRDAFIVAWNDGKSISLRDAKNIETRKTQTTPISTRKTDSSTNKMYRVTVGPIDDNASVVQLINKYAGGKDISKINNSDGKIVYSVGNFTTFEQAVDLREKLFANNISDVNINEVTRNN